MKWFNELKTLWDKPAEETMSHMKADLGTANICAWPIIGVNWSAVTVVDKLHHIHNNGLVFD